MRFKKILVALWLCCSLAACGDGPATSTIDTTDTELPASTTAAKAALGKEVFSDVRFSLNRSQSCATCHNPSKAFIDDRDNGVVGAVSLGDDGISLGNRNSPTASYAALVPSFSGSGDNASGGLFIDGRAADLTAQAGEPLVNPMEMNMPDHAAVVSRMLESDSYREGFQSIYGSSVFDDSETAFLALSDVIAEFQKTAELSPFDSKYDRAVAGSYSMSTIEGQGMDLFFSNRASCHECHRVDNLANGSADEVFTNFRYFNIGTPANQALNDHLNSVGQQGDLVANGDQGLFNNPSVNGDPRTRGAFRVPTLRNAAVTGPYMHNGVFANLQTVLHFYDHLGSQGGGGGGGSRPLNPETGAAWADPEVSANISTDRLNMRPLSDNDIDVLQCFLRTLTDAQFEADLPALRTGLNCSQ